jgi:hypothetical protein
MNNKKGLEISINFLVIIIVSIVVFVMGLALINKIMGFADDTAQGIDEETKKEIERLVGPDEVVSIPYHKKSLRVGDEAYFGVGIYSKENGETTFNVKVDFDKAYREDNSQISPTNLIDSNWNPFFGGNGRNYTLMRNDKEIVDIKLIVDSNIDNNGATEKGIYIFNLNVTYHNGTDFEVYEDDIYKLYLSVE